MDRRERDYNERNSYGRDYSRNTGYTPEDEHYHSARNLTNEFEREYQQERGYGNEDRGRNRPQRSYHESDMGDAYERISRDRERGSVRGDTSYHTPDRSRDRDYSERYSRDRFSNYRDQERRDQDRYRQDWDRNPDYGNMRPRYEAYGRYDSVGSDDVRGGRHEQHYAPGPGSGYTNSRDARRNYGDYREGGEGGYGRSGRKEDNWYSSGHRRDELNRYY